MVEVLRTVENAWWPRFAVSWVHKSIVGETTKSELPFGHEKGVTQALKQHANCQGITVVCTFQSLKFPCHIVVFVHLSLLLFVYPCVYEDCRLVVMLNDCNVWSSVFSHVFHRYIHIPRDFHILRVCHWICLMIVLLLQAWHVILLMVTALHCCSNLVVSLVIFPLCQVATCTC